MAVLTLESIVQMYLNDTSFQNERRIIAQKREASMVLIRDIVVRFINGESDLAQFRDELKVLHKMKEWGASGTGFLMEINKLTIYHAEQDNDVEANVRLLLRGLNSNTMGQRIEQFATFLAQEHTRLTQLGKKSHSIVSKNTSAFIISLFAFWLDETGKPYIYYPSLRLGLAILLNAKVIPAPSNVRITATGVEVLSAADNQAVSQVIDNLAIAAPRLKTDNGWTDVYWAERFLYWVKEKVKADPTFLQSTLVFVEETEEAEADEGDGSPATTLVLPDTQEHIDDRPLPAIPEGLLVERIAQIQRYILVDEEVVRRIYHALLAGHVILTGPPGTGKTELAQLIPEILWQNFNEPQQPHVEPTAYTTMLVTATEEWSARTLISSIMPAVNNGQVVYQMHYGYLTNAILKNWSISPEVPSTWPSPQRVICEACGILEKEQEQAFRGHWLIIDEFNRAHIDTALGAALTTLGSSQALLVPVDGKHVKLPLPKDFRIIGTLNSFDRNYLNQISEALKRRFSFVEVLPPSRRSRVEERRIVRYKALEDIAHLLHVETYHDDRGRRSYSVKTADRLERLIIINTRGNPSLLYTALHPYNPLDKGTGTQPDLLEKAFQETFDIAWRIFEVIRIYRQLGTAQAISLIRHMLIAGITQSYTNVEQRKHALEVALCDTIADQLQVLLPDELEVLYWYAKYDSKDQFIELYTRQLGTLALAPRRLRAQLEALSTIVGDDGREIMSDEEVATVLHAPEQQVAPETLSAIFHLDESRYAFPQFARRLRAFRAEHGL